MMTKLDVSHILHDEMQRVGFKTDRLGDGVISVLESQTCGVYHVILHIGVENSDWLRFDVAGGTKAEMRDAVGAALLPHAAVLRTSQ